MKCLVTGAAGRIGSQLAERLTGEGREVVGVDAFTDYYATSLKEGNLDGLAAEIAWIERVERRRGFGGG